MNAQHAKALSLSSPKSKIAPTLSLVKKRIFSATKEGDFSIHHAFKGIKIDDLGLLVSLLRSDGYTVECDHKATGPEWTIRWE